MPSPIELNEDQLAMLAGKQGRARQIGMRLLVDLAAMAGASRLVPISSAHLSGVSPLTGGLGLRLFLSRLADDPGEGVAVPTTLNAAGCDEAQFPLMRIVEPDFLTHHQEIIASYARIGVKTIQSCVPYEWEGIVPAPTEGLPAAWAESNAICFANSYINLRTNRESGLSALACALTGYAPDYGLLQDDERRPNLLVTVSAPMEAPTDFSILGDWIGKQRHQGWKMPFGPIPVIRGLPGGLNHEQRKALSAAAANYGCPLLYLEDDSSPEGEIQDILVFDESELARRYDELRPRQPVSLVVLGCPQASIGELRAIAGLLHGQQVTSEPSVSVVPPLWVFTSATAKAIADKTGIAAVIQNSGALLLENTCPEVVPYDSTWVSHILTNSMKAEHYIKSGLNSIPTSVMRLEDCIAVATGRLKISEIKPDKHDPNYNQTSKPRSKLGVHRETQIDDPIESSSNFTSYGQGLPSQQSFSITGEAFVTDTPITFLGYVNRETGVIEEEDHPANGQSLAGKIAIFPRGTGSSVAPYVLLELYYRGNAPMAIINTEIDQQTAPACSLEGIPYAFSFDDDLAGRIKNGDHIELTRLGEKVFLRVLNQQPDEY
jgi:predicted aconitase/predicted aconitase with swiveling domain